MTDATPTAGEAQAALAEAGHQASGVRRTDKQYARVLLLLAGMYLSVAVIMALYPRGGSRLAGIAVLVIFVGGFAACLFLLLRMRAFSRTGPLWFAWAAAGFTWWNAAVCGVSVVTGWWGFHQPATHFSVSALVAVIPLIVGAWLIGRRS